MAAPTNMTDPIQIILKQAKGRGYTTHDLLLQSIALCSALCFLDDSTIQDMHKLVFSSDTFRNTVCDYLEKNDPEILPSFLYLFQESHPEKIYDELFHYWIPFRDEKDRLCRLVERLILTYSNRIYRLPITVPSWLNRFVVELIQPSQGVFYDGTAGLGSTALEAVKYSQKTKGELQVITEESSTLLFHLSVLRARIHGFSFQQANEDCLAKNSSVSNVDFSIMFPPIGTGISIPVSRDLVCGSDWSFAFHQLNTLCETGVGVCRVSNGALFNIKNRTFRKHLLDLNVIDAVISLPKGSAVYSTSATSLVVFKKNRPAEAGILFAEIPEPPQLHPASHRSGDSGDIHKIMQDISTCYHSQEDTGLIKRISRSALDSDNLSPRQYLSQTDDTIHTVVSPENQRSSMHNTIQLQSAAKVYRGINPANIEKSSTGIGILRLSDVQDGNLSPKGVTKYDLSGKKNLERYFLEAGDILISCKGSAIKLSIVPPLASPLVLSHDFLGIRVDASQFDPYYLFYYLQSPFGKAAVNNLQVGSSIPIIRAADLELLPIPYIPLSLQKQHTEDLRHKELQINEQLQQLQAAKKRAYDDFYKKIGLLKEE